MLVNPSSPTILIISGAKGDTRRYRAFHLHQQLQLAGIPSVVAHITDARVEGLAGHSDVLIFHRTPYDPRVGRLIRSVRSRGGLVLVDEDDLIFDPEAFQWIDSPDFADPIRAKLYQSEMRRQQQTLFESDAAITSTDYLMDVVHRYGKPVWVHRNAANLEMQALSSQAMTRKRYPEETFILGYASGTPTHNRDFASIAPVVMDILRNNPRAELWVVGHLDLECSWRGFKNQVRKFGLVPWRELPVVLAQFGVNLAPLLLDNPFSQSKSEIKYMEAALVGVPTVASATDAFRFAIRHGENGLLAQDAESWHKSLQMLLDPVRRGKIADGAVQDGLTRYSAQVRSKQIVDLLNQVSNHFDRPYGWQSQDPKDDLTRYNWPVAWEEKPSLLAMGWYSLQSRGLMTLVQQLWITLRRFLARWIPYR